MKKISILSALFLMFLVFVGCATKPVNSVESPYEIVRKNPDLYCYLYNAGEWSNYKVAPLPEEKKEELKERFWNDEYWSLEKSKTQKQDGPMRLNIWKYAEKLDPTKNRQEDFTAVIEHYSLNLFFSFMKEKYLSILNKTEITGADWFIITRIDEYNWEYTKREEPSVVGYPEDWKREFLTDKIVTHDELVIKVLNKTGIEQDMCLLTSYPRSRFHVEIPAYQEKTCVIEDTEKTTYLSINQIIYYFYFGGDIGSEFYSEYYYNPSLALMRYLFNEYVFEFTYDEKDFHKNDAVRSGYFTYNFKYVKKSGKENKGTILKPMTDKETTYYWGKYVNGNKNGK